MSVVTLVTVTPMTLLGWGDTVAGDDIGRARRLSVVIAVISAAGRYERFS